MPESARPTTGRRRLLCAAALTAAGVGLAACGTGTGAQTGGAGSPAPAGGSSSAGSSTPVPTTTITGVPEAVASAGVVRVGSEIAYPPMEQLSAAGEPEGFDIGLFTAAAAKLGLRAEFENTKFDAILTGVQSGKYDAGASAFTVTKERLQAVNFVTYLNVGTQWATKTGNPAGVAVDDACGKKVAVQATTVQETDVRAKSDACQQAGKAAIDVIAEQDGQLPFNDVLSGKADAALSDLVTVAAIIDKTGSQLALLGDSYAQAPFGFAVARSDTAFARALSEAVNAVIADGTYTQLAEKWGVTQGAVTSSAVNPQVSD